MNVDPDEIPRCQAYTRSGVQCSRRGRWKIDLRGGVGLLGFQVVPPINCCFLCRQHLAGFMAVGTVMGMQSMLAREMPRSQQDLWNTSGFLAKHGI